MILLRTIAGSHLYGYATATSDLDYFEVHTEKFAPNKRRGPASSSEQTIVDGVDVVRMTLSHFMERATAGSHQALDAMFAANPEIDLLKGFRESYYAGYDVVPAYRRIISKFAIQQGYRKQRHALRALFNLNDILETGRYEPELSDQRISYITDFSHAPYPKFRKLLIKKSKVEIESLLPEDLPLI